MSNTYTQLHIQIVFAVKYRKNLISNSWKEELYKYMSGIIEHKQHKLLCINGVQDHIHILIGLRPHQALSDLVRDIKRSSSLWINEHKIQQGKFAWQEGFGAFSYSKSHVPNVIRYIQNQEEHHQKQTFLDEYKVFLEKFEIDYDEHFLFKELE